MLRPPGAGSQDHVRGRERALIPAQPAASAHRAHLPQPVGALLETLDRCHRNDLCPCRFRKSKVVFQQRVLGAVTAARHAAAAFQAAGAVWPGAAEIRVGHCLARRFGAVGTEEHPDRGGHKGVAAAHVVGDLLHDAIRVGEGRIRDNAQHPLRLLVVRHQLGTPVGDVRPLRIVEERLRRHVQRVGVVQRTAAHAGAGQDQHVAQRVDALNPEAAQPRCPQELAQIPRRLGEVLVGEAPARLQYAYSVTLFGQPERADASAETRTDDQDVEIWLHFTSMALLAGSKPAACRQTISCRRSDQPSGTP